MSDANIRVTVDTTEIDVALAKLDAALERANSVSGAVAAKPAGHTFSFKHSFPLQILELHNLLNRLCLFHVICIKHRTFALILRHILIFYAGTYFDPVFRLKQTGIFCLAHET